MELANKVKIFKFATEMVFDNLLLLLSRMALLTYKHKSHVVDTDGSIQSNADVDFYIDEVGVSHHRLVCLACRARRLFWLLWLSVFESLCVWHRTWSTLRTQR